MDATPTFAPLLRTVRKRAALVAAVVLVAVGAAGAWALRAPKKYRATATLLIEKPLPTDLGILAPFGALLESGRFASTECQVLESKAVLTESARRLELDRWPEFSRLDAQGRTAALADG